MAEFLASASTGAMNSVLKKLAAMLSDEYKLHKDVREDIEFMKDELEAMRAFLLKMSKVEDADLQAKLRIRAVRELSYDIEDYIDKSMVLVDHELASRTRGIKEFIDKSKNLLTKLKTQHQIAKEIKGIKMQVIEVSERFARYKLDEGTSKLQNSTIDPRVCAVYKDVSELVGIDGPVEDIINCLVDTEDESAKNLKVVSIVGFGGLGKTTLANQVYRKLATKFDCRAFVSISRNPDIRNIFKSLFSQICNQQYATDAWDEQQMIGTIRKLLEKKRYLIIVDDVWSIPTWEIIECFFPKVGCSSRIITTTRKVDVAHCSASGGDFVYRIKPLSMIDSRRLFFKRIFGCEGSCPSNLEEASNAILKKCGGLPLAIVTTSSLLASKHTADKWDWVQRSMGYAALAENSEFEGMNKILSLSYFDLPQHLRTCLLLVTIYPEDFRIPRMYLVERWIAEGFIHGNTRENLFKVGNSYFFELINRSLIQPFDLCGGVPVFGCRVHDTIYDFLVSKSIEENFAATINYPQLTCLLSPTTKVRRLTLGGKHNQEYMSNSANWNISQLRSLTIFGDVKKLPISSLSVLRVLDLSNCNGLENYHLENVITLSLLRYLSIIGKDITELPQRIGDLQYLEMLDVLGTSVKELPRSSTRLQRLAVLRITEETKLPDGFRKMQMLEELIRIEVSWYSMKFLEELGEMKNLRKLSMKWDIEKVEGDKVSYKEKLASALCKLEACNLRDLVIIVHSRKVDDFSSPFLALNSITGFVVEVENIWKCNKWLGSLANLEFIELYVREINQNDLSILGSIHTLTELHLYFYSVKYQKTIIIRGSQGFQHLESFFFDGAHVELVFEAGSMPMLRRLTFAIHAAKFKPTRGVFCQGIQHLSCLTMVSVITSHMGAKLPGVEALEDAFKSIVEAHPNHPDLNMIITPGFQKKEDEEED